MKYILSSKEMKQLDDNTINCMLVPQMVLMERAALSVVDYIEKLEMFKKVLVVCGAGNNGGDGIALARILKSKSYDVDVYLATNDFTKFTEACKHQYDIARKYDVNFVDSLTVRSYDIVCDALFGIGLSRNVEGIYRDIISTVNSLKAFKIALDIPSGLSADTGLAMGDAISCDVTITFGFLKKGLYLCDAFKYTGEIICTDIGITDASILDTKLSSQVFEPSDIDCFLPERSADAHKGSCGKLLVIAGSINMSGAAYFACKAAMKMGTGLVKLYTVKENVPIIHTQLPEAIVEGYDSFNENKLIELISWSDAILIGPGLSTSGIALKILKTVIHCSSVPVVIDADGLNLLADNLNLLRGPHTEIVITPHIGEMMRLTKDSSLYITENLEKVAKDFANSYQVNCVLKSHRTVTALPYSKSYININGNPGMATAGSGDVLAGIIAALLSQSVSGEIAAGLGVYIHSMAGDVMVKYKGVRGLLASDIIDGLDEILK